MVFKPRMTALVAVLAVLAGWVVYDQAHNKPAYAPGPQATRPPAATPIAASPAARPAQSSLMPQRPPLGQLAGDPFTPRSWAPPALTTASAAAAAHSAAPPAPVTPALPFRFAGRLYQNGGIQTFLARGEDIFPVNVGEALEGGYKVQSIESERVTLVYLATGVRQTVDMEPPLTAEEDHERGPDRTAAAVMPGLPPSRLQ
jgi:hypothetical protein